MSAQAPMSGSKRTWLDAKPKNGFVTKGVNY